MDRDPGSSDGVAPLPISRAELGRLDRHLGTLRRPSPYGCTSAVIVELTFRRPDGTQVQERIGNGSCTSAMDRAADAFRGLSERLQAARTTSPAPAAGG